MVNADLLVDIGPDLASASFSHGLGLTDIGLCLLTHAHEDHFDPEYIMSRHSDYGTAVCTELVVAGSAQTLRDVDEVLGRRCTYGSVFDARTQSALRLTVKCLEPFAEYELGVYHVTAYPADHGHAGGALLYSIEEGERAIFYGTDTAGLSEHVWQHLAAAGKRYDMAVLDQTYGIGHDTRPRDHLAASGVAVHAARFRTAGLLRRDAMVYATHISHEGYLEHDQLDRQAEENGYRIAYDGLVLELTGRESVAGPGTST